MSSVELPALYVDRVALVDSTARVVLVNLDPSPNEHGVPVESLISLQIVDTGPEGIRRASANVWVGGVLAFDGGRTPEHHPAYAGANAAVLQTSDTLRVVLHPLVPLSSLATVEVRVRAQTESGSDEVDESYAFVVEDRTAPRLVGAHALGPRLVRLGFDEPVRVPAGASFRVTPKGAPAVTPQVVAAAAEDATVRLTLETEMSPDVVHEVVALGVTDLAGNIAIASYDRATLVGFRPSRPARRRFDMWGMLPKHNRRDDQTGDLRRFIACLQEVTDLLLADLDRWPDIVDLERAPADFVEAILHDLGNPFRFELDTLGKRQLAAVLVAMYQQKGTAKGIRNAVRFLMGLDVTAITPLNADALVLGESELGVDWILAPSDRFARYAFDVEVSRTLTAAERQRLRTIVEYLKPAHTHFVTLLEPRPPSAPAHWELGVSEIGEHSDLH